MSEESWEMEAGRKPLAMKFRVLGLGAVYFGCFSILFIGSVALLSEQPVNQSNVTGPHTTIGFRSVVVDLVAADSSIASKLLAQGLGNGTVLEGELLGESLLFFDLAGGSFVKRSDADGERFDLTHGMGDTISVSGVACLYLEFGVDEGIAVFSERPGSLNVNEPIRFAFVVENRLGQDREYVYNVSLDSVSMKGGSLLVANGSAESIVEEIEMVPPIGERGVVRVELDTGEAIEFSVSRDIFAGEPNPGCTLGSVWSRTFGTGERDCMTSMIREGSGCVISGSIQTYRSDTLVGSDVYLLVLDEDGNRVRETIAGTNWLECPAGLAKAESGNYLVSGRWLRSLTDDPNTSEYEYYNHFYLAEVGEEIVWEKMWGENQNANAPFIAAGNDGTYVLVGRTGAPSGISSTVDIYVAKVNSSGNLMWERTYGGDDLDRPDCITAASDGGYVIAGMSDSFRAGTHYPRDLYMLKIDENGEKLWETTIDLGSWDWPAAVIEGYDGGYLVVGTVEYSMRGYPFIIKLDSEGKEVWRRIGQGNGNDRLESIVRAGPREYVAAGYIDTDSGRQIYFAAFDDEGKRLWETPYGVEGTTYYDGFYPYLLMVPTDGGDLVVVAEIGESFGQTDLQVVKLRSMPSAT